MAEGAPATAGPDEIRRLEAAAAAAWPARHVEPLDGWSLYVSGGGTRRTQSVQPIVAGERPVEDKISECERFYADRGVPCVFRLTPVSEPADLERRLDAQGYVRSDETCVQTAPLGRSSEVERVARVEIDAKPSEAWIDRCLALAGARHAHARAHMATLRRVAGRGAPAAFARIELDGEIAALGLGAVEDGYCFVGEVATDPQHRRVGLAREIMTSLMVWGREVGAHEALLQVVADNLPALELYAKLGFVDRYTYWYRARQPVDS